MVGLPLTICPVVVYFHSVVVLASSDLMISQLFSDFLKSYVIVVVIIINIYLFFFFLENKKRVQWLYFIQSSVIWG